MQTLSPSSIVRPILIRTTNTAAVPVGESQIVQTAAIRREVEDFGPFNQVYYHNLSGVRVLAMFDGNPENSYEVPPGGILQTEPDDKIIYRFMGFKNLDAATAIAIGEIDVTYQRKVLN